MTLDTAEAVLSIKDAAFPSPFASGLEYGSPARGPWNIVHIGMLIPESHQVFVCAQGCLRGVVLTAAEMNAMDRFSTIAIRENNVLDGDFEDLIIDGVTDLLQKLDPRPKALLIFTSCIHHFVACDLPFVYKTLRERFPDVDFIDCYMNPTMRKSGITPDELMRKQMYRLLKPAAQEPHTVSIIGNCFASDPDSDLIRMLRNGGWRILEITGCKTYADYQKMASSTFCISHLPVAKPAGAALEEHLGQTHLHLPLSYRSDEIRSTLQTAAKCFDLPLPDLEEAERQAELALKQTQKELGNLPIAIDYTATPRPLGLARLLLFHGFHVVSVYADGFIAEEREDFEWLQAHTPELRIIATIHPKMRLLPRRDAAHSGEKILAIGQKAAYFTGTTHFVNLLEGGGLFGFSGICRLAEQMRNAARTEADTESIIQMKGWGCCQ